MNILSTYKSIWQELVSRELAIQLFFRKRKIAVWLRGTIQENIKGWLILHPRLGSSGLNYESKADIMKTMRVSIGWCDPQSGLYISCRCQQMVQ